MKRLLFLVALSLVAMLIFASVAGAQKQATRTVMIQNFSFKPAHITIKRGTKVTWINKDSTTHTVTANNGRSFDSGRLRPGQRYTHTFRSAGKKRYHCEIHPDMRASVVVKR